MGGGGLGTRLPTGAGTVGGATVAAFFLPLRETHVNRKQVGAWALYDFANSVYPAVVQTAVFSLFYAGTIVGNSPCS